MIEIVNDKISCTEIKHHDCTPEMECPVAIEEKELANLVDKHTCTECKGFMFNDPYILEYGACGFCINELSDNHSATTGD